jgi:hypothetical protein
VTTLGIPRLFGAKKIRMFGWWQQGGEPFDHCSPEEAAHLVERRLARRRQGGFAIQLREPAKRKQRTFLQITIRGMSCKMGPRVTEDAADGSGTAQAAAEAYLIIFAGSYCPLIPKESIIRAEA